MFPQNVRPRSLTILLLFLAGAFSAVTRAQGTESTADAPLQHVHPQSPTVGSVTIWLLPKELEMRLAVTALPPILREGAAVYVLSRSGYAKVKDGTNPFSCFVSRRGGNFYPVCFDEEGARTIMPAYMEDAVLRLHGASAAEVDRRMAESFASGRYRPPARPGIAYMLSPATYMLNEGGRLTRYIPPHVMFYAPYLTDADIGGVMGKSAFVDRPGPHGMIIVAAGREERDRAAVSLQPLIDEVEALLELK
jgi:hypothetical protein